MKALVVFATTVMGLSTLGSILYAMANKWPNDYLIGIGVSGFALTFVVAFVAACVLACDAYCDCGCCDDADDDDDTPNAT